MNGESGVARSTCSARWRSFSASSMRSRVDFLSVGALNCCASCSASTWACMHHKPADDVSQAAMSHLQLQGRFPVPNSRLGMSDDAGHRRCRDPLPQRTNQQVFNTTLAQTSDMTRHELADPTWHSCARDIERHLLKPVLRPQPTDCYRDLTCLTAARVVGDMGLVGDPSGC